MRPATERVQVVFAHGLWMTGVESTLLRQRLKAGHDFDTRQFSYRSVRSTIADSAARLREYIGEPKCDVLHLVGHSLGGLVALHMLRCYPLQQPGRVVCLGTPFLGCRSAEGFAKFGLGLRMMRESTVKDLLDHGIREWRGDRDLGIIAGNHAIGLGRLFTRLDTPHDGTVAVSETRLPGAADHLVLPVSHTGMIFSHAVADQTAAFLNRGKFDPGMM